MSARGGGGSAGSGGYDYQAKAIAYITAHMLASRPLNWTELRVRDIPSAVEAETGRSGDDIQVEFQTTTASYSIQAKRSLSGQAQLLEALGAFISDLPNAPEEYGILIVGPRTHSSIAYRLNEDLQRFRAGRQEPLGEMAKRVFTVLEAAGQIDLARRLTIVWLHVEGDSEAGRNVALAALLPLVGYSDDQAALLWDQLVLVGHDMITHRGRHTRESLEVHLRQRGILIGAAAVSQPDETLTLVRKLAIVHGIATDASAAAGQPVPPSTHAATQLEAGLQAQLDGARLLLESQPQAALAVLAGLDARMEAAAEPIPSDLRRRVRNNIGVARVRLGRIAEAAEAFERTLAFGPSDPTTLINLARVERQLGRVADAVAHAREALNEHQTDGKAWGLLLELNEVTEDDVPESVRADPDFLTSKAFRTLQGASDEELRSREGAAEAAALLRQANAAAPTDPSGLFLLAYALAGRMQHPVRRSTAPPESLAEADDLLSTVLARLGDNAGFSTLLQQALLLRATIRRAQARDAEALVDAERAYALTPVDAPDRWRAATLYAALLLERGEPIRALAATHALSTGEGGPGVHLMRARALVALGRTSDVDDAITSALAADDASEPDELRVALSEVALNAALTERADALLEVVDQAKVGWVYHLMRGRVALQRGQWDQARAEFESAVSGADGEEQRRVRYELGIALADRLAFAEAVELFEAADAWTLGDGARSAYVAALWEAGRRDRAAEQIRVLEVEGPLPAWALRMGSLVAQARNDLAGETNYLERLRHLSPADRQVALFLATSYTRQHRLAEAIGIFIELVGLRDLPAPERMHAAHQLFLLGERDEALRQAFRSVRDEPESAELQRGFLALCLRSEQKDAALVPEEVAPETHVVLEPIGRGNPEAYTIYSEEPIDILRNEVLADDLKVAPLIGRKVGDTVVLRPGMPAETALKITEIQSAITHLFQDLLEHFNERHPTDLSIQKFTIGEEPTIDSLHPVIVELQHHADRAVRAFEAYDENRLPLGTVAELVGRDPGTVYTALVQRGLPYHVEGSNQSEFLQSVSTAMEDVPVVLTGSAVYTARELMRVGHASLDLLLKMNRMVYTPQSLLDELEGHVVTLDLARRDGQRTMIIGPAGIQAIEVTPEETRREYDVAVAELEWLRRNCTISPRPASALGVPAQRLRRVLGVSGADALELRHELGGVLFADDFGLRFRVAPEVGPRSFSTWALLQAAARTGSLTEKGLRSGIVALIQLHHQFIPVDGRLLVGVLRDHSFSLNHATLMLLQQLRGTELELRGVVRVAAQLLRGLSLEPVGAAVLGPVTQVVLEHIAAGRRIVPALHALGVALDSAFGLLPIERARIQDHIDRFVEAKRRAGSLQ